MKKQKIIYEAEDDVLNIWLPRESGKKIDYAEDNNGVIIHYTKDRQPVYIEILFASRFLNKAKKSNPAKFGNFSAAIPHRIK